jgi:ribonuclease VapC
VILDSSAIIAILRGENEALDFTQRIASAPGCKISAVNFTEAAIVIDARHAAAASNAFDAFFSKAAIEIVPVTYEHAQIARQAYRTFGKGSGHRAKLNFGDCFAYALSKANAEPLLYKGKDFAQTDVAST